MRITLNELRNLIRNILKENIEFPDLKNLNISTTADARLATSKLSESAVGYFNNNIKTLKNNGNFASIDLFKVEVSPNNISDSLPLTISLELMGSNELNLFFNLQNFNGKATIGQMGSSKITFESMNDINVITDFIYELFDKVMGVSADKNYITNKIISLPKITVQETPDYTKSSTDPMDSSEFRRSGGRSYGKRDMPFKSKFGNEPAEEPVTSSGGKTYANYNEWIGNESAENQKAIAVLYRMVEKGRMEEDEFDSEIQELLNTPLNEIRNIVKKLIKELKWSDRIEIYKEPLTYKEKKKWEENYYKHYDDWMPLLEYFEIYQGLSKDAREFASKLYSAVGYGNMTRDTFNRAIANESKENRWGIEITKKDREEEGEREKEAREKFAKEKRF